jgi:hypothetical protein
MELIETKTVGSGGAATIEFTGLGSYSSTYTDLYLVWAVRGSAADNGASISFNGSTSNRTARNIFGDGAGGTSNTSTSLFFYGGQNSSSWTANTFNNAQVYIPNYSGSNYKSISADIVNENNGTDAYMSFTAGLWSDTSAITSITITPGSGTFDQHSTASLYGISAVTSTPKATGGIVSQDASYWYHTFPFTSTFTPTSALSADILCIAGGGAGGGQGGGGGAGGGGAGGLLLFSSQTLTSSTAYTCLVGGGGAFVANEAGTTGFDSQFGSLTLVKGGGGGGRDSSTVGSALYMGGKTGGSGGGGGINADNSTTPPAGSATSGQGNNGGTGWNAFGSGAGGGGAGSAGANTVSQKVAGAGGNGVNTYSSWANATFTGVNGYFAGGAGGGGGPSTTTTGGAGGLGGGGNGAGDNQSATAGITNSGGGGGAGGYPNGGAGQNGGSGLVIVRYAK